MATIVKTEAGTWKALVRKTGWPTNTKTFRTKRDAEDWARRTEDEMVRGVDDPFKIQLIRWHQLSILNRPSRQPVNALNTRPPSRIIASDNGQLLQAGGLYPRKQ